jgi:uncharacterized glyoxalase superfamily protein PhnB
MTSVRTNTSSRCHWRARSLRGTIGHRRHRRLVCGCGPALQRRVILWRARGSTASQSEYEAVGLRAVRPYVRTSVRPYVGTSVRPYLIVGNADEAIDFYRRVFQATEPERLPRAGLRLYVADVEKTYARARPPAQQGTDPRTARQARAAGVYDPSGVTWWLAAPIE